MRRTRDFRRSRKKTIVKFNLILIDLKIFNGIFLRSSQQFIVKIGKKRTKTIESLFQDQDMVKKKKKKIKISSISREKLCEEIASKKRSLMIGFLPI